MEGILFEGPLSKDLSKGVKSDLFFDPKLTIPEDSDWSLEWEITPSEENDFVPKKDEESQDSQADLKDTDCVVDPDCT